MVKSTLAFIAIVALVTLSTATSVKPVDATLSKTTERLPAICTAQSTINTGMCVCYLNFSNSPQFSFYTQAELNAGRRNCLAQFGSRSFILTLSSKCDKYRQNPPSQNVNLYWLLGEANRLINRCVPDQPRLRFPGQPL